jgi:hypothetical protein
MNECPFCYHELVNVIYGTPGSALVALAKNEGVALGGKFKENKPKYYCYGCQEAFSPELLPSSQERQS